MLRLYILLLLLLASSTEATAQLRVTAPNGGERFRVGSTTTIRWEGIPASDTVTLEYSTDAGGTWRTITTTGTGLQHTWVGIPNTPSTRCLLRASSPGTAGDSILYLRSSAASTSFPEAIHFAEFSPNGTRVVGGGAAGNLYIWDAATGALLSTIPVETGIFPSNPGITRISSARYSPDGTLIATVSPIDAQTGSTIRIFDAATGAKLREWQRIDAANVSGSDRCAFSPDGSRLLVTGLDGGIVYTIATGAEIVRLKGYTVTTTTDTSIIIQISSMVGCDWLPNGSAIIGSLLISSSAAYNLLLSDPVTGDTIRSYKLPTTGAPQTAAFSPDGRRIIAAFSDNNVYIIDVATGALIAQVNAADDFLSAAEYSHTGRTFATAGADNGSPNWKVKLYDSAGTPIRTVGTISNGMQNLDFSPDDASILVSCIDGVRIFRSPSSTSGESDISDSLWTIYIDSNATITVAVGSAHARQGENVTIPVTISDPAAALGAGATRVECTLRYNVSLLDPAGSTPRGTADARQRTIALSLAIPTSGDTLLAALPFVAALGDDSVTTLDISGTVTDAPTVTVIEQDGIFTLDSLCHNGGTRLLNPNSRVALKVAGATPVSLSHGIDVEIETMEIGRTRLYLVDPTGRIVQWLFDGSIEPGTWVVHTPLDGVGSGRYLLLLTTPTTLTTLPIEVVR